MFTKTKLSSFYYLVSLLGFLILFIILLFKTELFFQHEVVMNSKEVITALKEVSFIVYVVSRSLGLLV